jgi:hypothetical protein
MKSLHIKLGFWYAFNSYTFVCSHHWLVTPASVARHVIHGLVSVIVGRIGTSLVDLSVYNRGRTSLARPAGSHALFVTFLVIGQTVTLEALGGCI